MIDTSTYVIPMTSLLLCILGGAFSKCARRPPEALAIKGVSALAGMVSFLLFYGVAVDALNASGYIPVIAGILVMLAAIFTSLKLVEFGERIGEKTGVGLDTARREAMTELGDDLSKLLDGFRSELKSDVQSIVQAAQGAVSSATRSSDQVVNALGEESAKLQKELAALATKHDSLLSSYGVIASGYNSMLKDHMERIGAVQRELAALKSERELLSRDQRLCEERGKRLEEKEVELERRGRELADREARSRGLVTAAPIGGAERTVSRAESGTGKITKEQARSVLIEWLRSYGLDAKLEEEGYVSIRKDGVEAVVFSSGVCTVRDEPKERQRRIYKENIPTAAGNVARERGVPMVLHRANTENERMWLSDPIPHGQIENWEGVTTPVSLAKNDEESLRQLQESNLRVLRALGVKV
ncbi:MAG: hypothetical protein LYZ66_03470 [Nitrososphaerales archaeon]|nr:hypothetical protein [Nitrososphaerales archaeon]